MATICVNRRRLARACKTTRRFLEEEMNQKIRVELPEGWPNLEAPLWVWLLIVFFFGLLLG